MAPTPKKVAFAEQPEILTTPATPTKPASSTGLKSALKRSSSTHVDLEEKEDLLSATLFSDLSKDGYPKDRRVFGKLLDNLETRFKEADEKLVANLGAPTTTPPFTYLSKGSVTYLDVVENMTTTMQQLQLKQQAKANLLQLTEEEAAAQRATIDERLAALRPKIAAATTKLKAAERKRAMAEREKTEAAARQQNSAAKVKAAEAQLLGLQRAKLSAREKEAAAEELESAQLVEMVSSSRARMAHMEALAEFSEADAACSLAERELEQLKMIEEEWLGSRP